MNTHANILEELKKYEGGKFAPTSDDHAHIDRGAFLAVTHWCKERDIVLYIFVSHEFGWRLKTHTGIVIAEDPDEHSMWLSALVKINGGAK